MAYASYPSRRWLIALAIAALFIVYALPGYGVEDSAPPILGTIAPTAATVGSTYNVTIAYSDGVGVTSCGLYVNKTFIGPMMLTGAEAIRVHTFPQLATYSVEVRCYDAAGNEGKSSRSLTTTKTSGPISPTVSTLSASPNTTVANGSSAANITVTLKTMNGAPVAGIQVTLFSSRGPLDTITPNPIVSAANGAAVFSVRSGTLGNAQLTAAANGTQLAGAPTVVFMSPNIPTGTAAPGNLMKLPCAPGAGINDPCKAVYYYGGDKQRHAFPNEKTYFTWYNDFSGILEVTPEFMASIQLGRNVTYRPGIRMVKFATLPKVYAVSQHRTLRWVANEEMASTLYGPEWNKNVHDINDVFFNDYRFGADISSAADYRPSVEASLAQTIDANF